MEASIRRRFELARSLARDAGRQAKAMRADRRSLNIAAKGGQDWVSDADREVEHRLRAALVEAFPEDAVLGEEGGLGVGDASADPQSGIWVLDPIDGTTCYLAGIPQWCVAIAYVEAGVPRLGVIYDANADELFAAVQDHGATLDGVPIQASAASALDAGLTAIGMTARHRPEASLRILERLVAEGGMYTRLGACALGLAYVASGRLLGCYEPLVHSWDFLAGMLIVREAGGWTNAYPPASGLHESGHVVASAPAVAGEMAALLEASGVAAG